MSDSAEYKKYLEDANKKLNIRIKELKTETEEIKDKISRTIIDFRNYLKFLGIDEKQLDKLTILHFKEDFSKREILEIIEQGRLI